jgi:hypothetical protein
MTPVWLRNAVSTALNRHELHLDVRSVVPHHALDVNAIRHLRLVRFRRARDVVEIRKISA